MAESGLPLVSCPGTIAGIDLIGNQLIEVNVTSPTGLREIEALSDGHHAAAALELGERPPR